MIIRICFGKKLKGKGEEYHKKKTKEERAIVLPTSEIGQRVTIPQKPEEDATPFYVDRLFFGEESGLYFLLECSHKETRTKLEAALRLLGDMGIGTDRSVGYGQFEVSYDTITLNLPKATSYQLNLSLFCPTYEELQQDTLRDASYQLLRRGGWVSQADKVEHQTLQKSSIYMFTEGSVFSNSQKLTGKIADLRPRYAGFNHPVWRDGTAIFLPIQPKVQ